MRARIGSPGPGRPGLLVTAITLLLVATAGRAAAAGCTLTKVEGGRVADVVDGASVALDDGRVVRLAGIAAPEPPLGAGANGWPLADVARQALGQLTLGRSIRLAVPEAAGGPAPSGPERDRYGRIIAFAAVDGGIGAAPVPLAEAMLRQGLARVMPGTEPIGCLAPLFATEREAREKRLGLWDDPYYAIRAAGDRTLADRGDAYDLVEGRVVSVGVRGPTAYLDFGRNWRTDFTAVVTGAAGEAMAALGHPPATLAGRLVRLRGWIEQRDGPSLRVTYPGQLELLDDGD